MQTIIVGCGRVGVMLAQLLEQDDHQVTMIDKNPMAFRRLGNDFQGRTVTGIGFDRDVLREAGIEHADHFAAVTSGDNSNFIAATVARDTFRVPVVVARVYDPQREQIYRRLGIHTISSTIWGAHKIRQLLFNKQILEDHELGNGEVHILQLHASESIAGRTVGDVAQGGPATMFAIVRNGKAFVPAPDTVVQQGDIMHLSVAAEALARLQALLNVEGNRE